MYENKQILKSHLLNQLKSYRNISIKAAVCLWSISFGSYFTILSLDTDPINFMLVETIIESTKFSAIFALIGYCAGSIIGKKLQRDKLSKIVEEKEKKQQMLEEQIALRQSKLDQYTITLDR
jgi:hypothetical protein